MLSTEKATKLIHFLQENLDNNIDVQKFLYWQKMSHTVDPYKIRNDSKWYIMVYYNLLDEIMEWTFIDRENFTAWIWKTDKWFQGFISWMERQKPKVAEFIEEYSEKKDKLAKELQGKYAHYKSAKWDYLDDTKAKMEIVKMQDNKDVWMLSFKDTLWEILDLEFNSPEIRQLFEEHNKNDKDIYSSYDDMLKAMSNDMMATKQTLLQWCMLAITWYYNSLKDRLAKWERIPYYEMKYAYDIIKIENNEPTRITESRSKNQSININIPIDPSSIESYMKKADNQDLSLNIADNHKQSIKKFNKNVK